MVNFATHSIQTAAGILAIDVCGDLYAKEANTHIGPRAALVGV